MKTRILSMILACLMVCATLLCVACADPGNGDSTTTAAEPVATTEAPAESTALVPNIDDTVKFNTTVKVLMCKEQMKQTLAAEGSEGMLADALQARIAKVEEKLGIKFEFIEEPGNWSSRASFIQKVEVAVSNGCDYDLVIAYNLNPPTMAVRGLLQDLNSSDYTDVAPKYFEVMLKFKYSSDSSTGQIYDMIRRNVMFDFGYIFSENFTTNPIILYRDTLAGGETGWSTKYKRYDEVFKDDLQAIIDKMSNQSNQ